MFFLWPMLLILYKHQGFFAIYHLFGVNYRFLIRYWIIDHKKCIVILTIDYRYLFFSIIGMLPVRWMAPESLADGLFTPMSDIWSYGVLLYEMITFGSFPFQGLSNNQVMEHVKAGHTLSIPSGIKPQLETLLKVSFIMYEHST